MSETGVKDILVHRSLQVLKSKTATTKEVKEAANLLIRKYWSHHSQPLNFDVVYRNISA